MNTKQFIEYGKDILEFLGNHHDNIADINVVPNVEPGYLRNIIPCKLYLFHSEIVLLLNCLHYS